MWKKPYQSRARMGCIDLESAVMKLGAEVSNDGDGVGHMHSSGSISNPSQSEDIIPVEVVSDLNLDVVFSQPCGITRSCTVLDTVTDQDIIVDTQEILPQASADESAIDVADHACSSPEGETDELHTRLVAFNETVHDTPADQEADSSTSSTADAGSQEHHKKHRLAMLWKLPAYMVRAVSMTHRAQVDQSTLPAITATKRSSMSRASSRWRLLHKKQVRFKGMLTPGAISLLSFLIRFFSQGSAVLVWWDRFTACCNAADFLILPLAAVAREYITARDTWAKRYGTQAADHAAGKYALWSSLELALDAVFVLDFVVRIGRACVLDMGFEVSTADRLVDKAPALSTAIAVTSKNSSIVKQASTESSLVIGPAVRSQLFMSIPLRLLLMTPFWAVHNQYHLSNAAVSCAALARTYRLFDLMSFFSARQEDVAEDVQWVAFCKFSFIIYSTGHWLGCMYYGLAAYHAFDQSLFQLNWVDAWVQQTDVDFSWLYSSPTYDYVVMLFKGCSVLTNVGYEVAVPERIEEVILSIFAQNIKVIIDAYILGTLFHYLVKKDPEVEAARDLMAALNLYCKERALPSELTRKMEAHLLFQQKKSSVISTGVLRSLPLSLQSRVAQATREGTIKRNMHLFNSCNEQFLKALMMALVEVSLMPAEPVINQGDLARQLCFAVKGTLVVTDGKGVLIELLSGEGTAPCAAGAVSFLLGVWEPYSVHARENEESAVLVLTKADFDDVISHYPEQSDVLITNMLLQYGLTRDGEEMCTKGFDQRADEEGYAQLRAAIQCAMKRSQETALADLTYAASNGQVDVIKHLLAWGLPIDAGDYDGRTALHLAVAEEHVQTVRILLDRGASVDVTDRWGKTPLLEAVELNNRPIAEALVGKGANLRSNSFLLVKDAAENDTGLLQLACTKAGVDPKSCDYDRRSVLHTACASGNCKAVEALLSMGVDVNCTDRWNGTPILDAVKAGSGLIIDLLQTHGACAPSAVQSDALFNAVRCGDIGHTNLLLEAGATAKMANYDKVTALHVAAGAGQPLTLYRLITCRAVDVNLFDAWGLTPLDHAVRAEHWSCAILLLSNAGECRDQDLEKKLHGAQAQDVLPGLTAVHQCLSHAVHSTTPEMEVAGSVVMCNCDDALTFRRQVYEKTIQALPRIRECAEAMGILLEDSLSLVRGVSALGEIATAAGTMTARGENQESQLTGPSQERNANPDLLRGIAKAAMSVIMRSPMVVNTLRDLADEIGDCLNLFEPSVTEIHKVFMILEIPSDPQMIQAKDCDSLLFGVPGVRQLSLTRLLTWPYFRHQVQSLAKAHVQHRKLSQSGSSWSKSKPDGMLAKQWKPRLSQRFSATVPHSSPGKVHPLPESLKSLNACAGGTSVKSIVLRLNTVYTWMSEAFVALDLNKIGRICIETHGPLIQQALAGAGLQQLWHSLTSEIQNHGASEDAFMHVCVNWMGLQESWAVAEGLQRSRSVEVLDEAGGSQEELVQTDSIDEEGQLNDAAEYEALKDLDELCLLEEVLALHQDAAFLAMLSLSVWEQLLWSLGFKLSCTEMAIRAFNFIDDNGNNAVCITAMEMLFRIIQDELPVAKASFDYLENLQAECARDPSRAVRLDDFMAFFQTFPSTRVQHKLPPDAHWGIAHPDSCLTAVWDVLIRILSLYFFWEAPFNIAFQASDRLGFLYQAANQILEGLLIVDMFVNIFRAFYNEQGVLIYNLKAIRIHYINSSFFLDLVAAMPFQVLVQINGDVNHAYASWLRLPKMLRIYRMLQLYKQMGRSVAQASVSRRVLQLMPLIMALIHVYGCIWWYIGTVGRAVTFSKGLSLTGSWIYYYSGLGTEYVWSRDVSIQKQYVLSCYWAASTLSTASLVGDMTPKNMPEVVFTIWSMLTTLTVYAFVVGEISNAVMANDQALVSMREEVSRVQTFLSRHQLPRDLAVDIVRTFNDSLHTNSYSAQQIHGLMSSNLRVEVAMHMSLPLLKGNSLFFNCSSGFLAGVAAQLRETVLASDEFMFHANEVCDDLYLISSSSVDILERGASGNEVATETRSRGDLVGELSFFFRLRHLHTACVGRIMATVFMLPYNDYKQLAATYIDDDAAVLVSLANSVQPMTSQPQSARARNRAAVRETPAHVIQKVQQAMERRTKQHVVKLLHAVAENDLQLVKDMIESGKVGADTTDYDGRTALHIAASEGHMGILQTLVENHSADPHAQDRNGGTPLDDAIRHRQTQAVQYLVQLDCSRRHVIPQDHYSAQMIQAAADDDVEYIKMVIGSGMNPNCADYDHRTPLHLAASNSSMSVLQYLVDHHAIELGPVDVMGHTPLWNAILNGDHRGAQLLRSRGGPIQPDVAIALCDAACRNDARFFELLLLLGIDTLSRDPYGRTALHVAATSNALEVVSMICKAKSVDINPVDGYGCTPLDNARMAKHAPIAALLERAGAKPGQDESLISKAQEVKEWVRRSARSQQQLHLDKVLTNLPEQAQAAHAATAVQNQTEFVHAGYINMQILTYCLHDTLIASARARQSMISSRECQKRLLLTIQALIKQFRCLQDLLMGKLSEMVLQRIPFRLFATQDLEPLCELICLGIETAVHRMQSLELHVKQSSATLPTEKECTLKHMLAVGVLPYVQLPISTDVPAENFRIFPIQEWSTQLATSPSEKPLHELQFYPREQK